jgi:hypothetical protein
LAAEQPVDLLWTGGWDSTWRLMTLLLGHRLAVQPSYLRDGARASMPVELDAMARIREALAERFPQTRRLLLPTRIVPVVGPPPDDDIQHAFRRLMRMYRFGDQYAFLARFCREYTLQDVELSVEWFHVGTTAVLAPYMEQALTPQGLPTWKLRADCDPDLRTVFGAFSFPLLETHKSDMADDVVQREWTDVMAMTWFCHRPSKGLRPCGFCNPCQYAVEEGFSWRIPRSRRALSKLYGHTLWPLRGRARQWLQRWKVR